MSQPTEILLRQRLLEVLRDEQNRQRAALLSLRPKTTDRQYGAFKMQRLSAVPLWNGAKTALLRPPVNTFCFPTGVMPDANGGSVRGRHRDGCCKVRV